MNFIITFSIENAAFADDENGEITRILKEVARKVEQGHDSGLILDINGNKVGHFTKGK
jgi:hypothetical protein